MENKFIEIISSPMMNTSSIQRYSGTKMVESESLSQHIVDTQMMGYMMINHMNNCCGETLDRSLYLEKALHHDLEESMTGDVIRTLKYHNPNILREMQNVAHSVASEIYEKYFEDTEGELLALWDGAKQGREGFILKLVDTLTVANRVIKEVDFYKNAYFLRVAYEVNFYLKDLKQLLEKYASDYTPEAVQYLGDVLDGASYTIRRIIYENRETATRYNIIEKSLLKEGME